MFIKDRKYILDAMILIQRKHCSYDMLRFGSVGDQSPPPPPLCDCKYGYDLKPHGEKTGCPELRCVTSLLFLMTDEEYEEIMERGNHIFT